MLTRWRVVRMGHRAPLRDNGFTLIEVIVGMTLMGLFGAVALSFFVSSTQQNSRTTEQSLNSGDARVAVDNISSLLTFADTPTARAGFPTGRFEVLTPYRIVFYSNMSTSSRGGSGTRTPPSKIDIGIVNGQLVEKVYAPKIAYTSYPSPYDYTTNYPTSPTRTMTLLRAISNDTQLPAAVPVFTYCTDATEPTVTCTAATNANSVAAVGVEVIVPGAPGSSPQRVATTVAVSGAVS